MVHRSTHAYQKYYSSKQGHRTDDQWIAEFKKIMKNGGGIPEFEKEIDDYVYKFWDECDKISVDYLASVYKARLLIQNSLRHIR